MPLVIQYTLAATGTPRARPVSSTKPASTGRRARPSRCGGVTRWASGPDRLTRPRPRLTPSPASTTRLSRTRTKASAHAAGRLNAAPISVKISVVKVW